MVLTKSSRVRSLVAGLFLLSLASCAPRGETKTLDEVLQIARDRYAAAEQQVKGGTQLGADSSAALSSIVQGLEKSIASGGTEGAQAQLVEQGLTALLSKAGYASRAAIAEASKEYGELSRAVDVSGSADGAARAKLAAARVYTLLASELETTRFGL